MPPVAAREFLHEKGIEYFECRDGTIIVPGSIRINGMGLTELPDFSGVVIAGDFDCTNNLLASLSGAPQVVGGSFRCSINLLENLDGGPRVVGGNYECIRNRISSTRGVAEDVGGRFWCSANRMIFIDCVPKQMESLETDADTERVKVHKRPNPRRKPEVISRLLLEKEIAQIGDNVALESRISIKKPLKLKPQVNKWLRVH